MRKETRREFLRMMAAGAIATRLGWRAAIAPAQVPGERPKQDAGLKVLNPLARVPVSLIIDDSTCLVNLARFAIPQFAAANNYQDDRQDWRKMSVEIPDDFVRKFGHWCGEHGVKGKYSVVPYPACVGRLDRELPGWPRKDVDASIDLVRELMTPNWDIHPEMVTHTWAIDVRTGHPYPERTLRYQENWGWSEGKSTDELTEYMSYALRILQNVGLPCEGITTPGGFGTRVLPELAQAVLESCRDVFRAEIPHYFRHAFGSGDRSVAPRVEYASQLGGPDPKCVVSIIGCTDDWTGGWDASFRGEADRFINGNLSGGRMVEIIERGEPAIMVCHWAGIYFNGEETGFQTLQEVIRRLHARYDHLAWMKLGEIARYWAAKELTRIERQDGGFTFHAPFACPRFTVQFSAPSGTASQLTLNDHPKPLQEVAGLPDLRPGSWTRDPTGITACFDLPQGASQLRVMP
jgi:hypothetical protein